jgi:hypothetical protein
MTHLGNKPALASSQPLCSYPLTEPGQFDMLTIVAEGLEYLDYERNKKCRIILLDSASVRRSATKD